jgi:hypothetical protein
MLIPIRRKSDTVALFVVDGKTIGEYPSAIWRIHMAHPYDFTQKGASP